MSIAILYNTFSAKGKGLKLVKVVQEVLIKNNIAFEAYENEWAIDEKKTSTIILIGGDGTINYFINKFYSCEIPILILPGGTGNDLYWKLYGNLSAEEILRRWLNTKSEIATKGVDVGKCVIDKSSLKYFINGIGLGFDGEVLKSMNTIRFIGGHMGYMFAVIKNILKYREPSYNLKFDNQNIETKCTILNIANSSRTGGGFLISPEADLYDNKLNLLHCFVPSFLRRLVLLLKVEKGKHVRLKEVKYRSIDNCIIKANKQIMGQCDGELIKLEQAEISLSNWKLPIIIV